MPDGHLHASAIRQDDLHYGLSRTFSNFTGRGGKSACKISRRCGRSTARLQQTRLRRNHGRGARVQDRQGHAGSKRVVFASAVSASTSPGRAMVCADKSSASICMIPESCVGRFGNAHVVNPRSRCRYIVQHFVARTDGGADFTCTVRTANRHTTVMRLASEAAIGAGAIVGLRGPKPQEIATRPFPARHGRFWHGTAFVAARGAAHRRAPQSSTGT